MPNYKSKYKGSQIDGLLDFVNDNKNNIAMQSDIPTVPSDISDFNNDSGFIDNTVNNLVNYYLKTETYTQSEINALVSAAASGGFVKVNELPTEDINIKAIYLVPYTGSRTKNLYEEYIYIDGDWEMIGTTKIDLSNYITTEALSTALTDYVLTTDLNTLIANYYNKTEIAGLLSNKVDTSTIGQANGVASLDNNGKVPSSQLPEQGGVVSDFNDLTNRPQKEVTSIASLIDPVPLPTHNQVGSVGFTPVGTVISVMGTTAPTHYLACNGQTVNIADYPELAQYFEEQFGSVNNFGGDGTTTFAVPDLRGEFLRGTGTNSHANGGNGAAVGVHQDATEHLDIWRYNNFAGIQLSGSGAGESTGNADSHKGEISSTSWSIASPTSDINANRGKFTSRPTNTSVLFCIATKDIYIDARNIYSTTEKVVGEWIDGKPLYQKTIVPSTATPLPNKTVFIIPTGITANVIETLVDMTGIIKQNTTDGQWRTLPQVQDTDANLNCVYQLNKDGSTISFLCRNGNVSMFDIKHITLQYTKTTD